MANVVDISIPNRVEVVLRRASIYLDVLHLQLVGQELLKSLVHPQELLCFDLIPMADGLNDDNDILLILELFHRILIFLSFLVDALINLSRLILFASRGSAALCFLHWVFHRIEVLLFSIIVISANG